MRLRRLCYSVLLAAASAALSSMFVSSVGQNQGADAPQFVPATPLPWAYPVGRPAARPEDDGALKRLPGSNAAFTASLTPQRRHHI